MTLRDDRGAILSREAYTYEFDKFGNWTRMVTSLVVFENGELKREPVEVTYRTVTYYFDDNIAKAVDEVKVAGSVPEVVSREVKGTGILKINYDEIPISSPVIRENPPPLVVKSAPAPAPVTSTPV